MKNFGQTFAIGCLLLVAVLTIFFVHEANRLEEVRINRNKPVYKVTIQLNEGDFVDSKKVELSSPLNNSGGF